MNKSLVINIEGMTQGDLELALDEVKRLISEGYKRGYDSNETGSYQFNIDEK